MEKQISHSKALEHWGSSGTKTIMKGLIVCKLWREILYDLKDEFQGLKKKKKKNTFNAPFCSGSLLAQ